MALFDDPPRTAGSWFRLTSGACFLDTGDGRAGFGSGDFDAEPTPETKMRKPGRGWHWGKVLFEKYWFWKWF